MRRSVIVGATSAIAMACARELAARGDRLLLAARHQERLATVAADLRARHAVEVETLRFAATPATDYVALARALWGEGIDVLLIAHGAMPEQAASQDDVALTREVFEANALGTISLLAALAAPFAARGRGAIAVISSVAGDRGRRSNYVYGASKSALTVYLQGLRARLSGTGVRVLTIKPGPVDTPMTAHLPKGVLWSRPQVVGRAIAHAIARGRDDEVYVPRYWGAVMCLLRHIPEWLFKRLPL